MHKAKTFRAPLERLNGKGTHWTIVRLPFSVADVWNSRGSVRVRIEVNGFEYRTSLLPTRSGEHFFVVNKKMQHGGRISPGGVATFTVALDLEPREVTVPAELQRALNQDRAVKRWFDGLSYTFRKWMSEQVSDAKSPETRRARAERIAEQIMETMEAELELPPMIRLSLSRIPGAERAWQQLSKSQQRGHLLGIFHYRTPQSRLKRLEKTIEAMLAAGEKK